MKDFDMGVSGKWYNELGSWMFLDVSPDGRTLEGTYHSAVGDAVKEYPLAGRIDDSPGETQGLGWVVSWQNREGNSHCVTAWSGHYRVLPQTNEEAISTTWLLTLESKPEDDWDSTSVGRDIFTRRAPTAEQVDRARALRGLKSSKADN